MPGLTTGRTAATAKAKKLPVRLDRLSGRDYQRIRKAVRQNRVYFSWGDIRESRISAIAARVARLTHVR